MSDSRERTERDLDDALKEKYFFKKAYLIGFLNSRYENESSLVGKIDAVEKPLRKFAEKIGFETYDIHVDLNTKKMIAELERFADFCVENGALVVFFYLAGHGIFGDSPILLGTDATEAAKVLRLAEIGISENQILDIFGGISVYLVFDTCLTKKDVENPQRWIFNVDTNSMSLRSADIFQMKEIDPNFWGVSRVMTSLDRTFEEYARGSYEYRLSDVFGGAARKLHWKGEMPDIFGNGHTAGAFDFRDEVRFFKVTKNSHTREIC